MGAKRSYGEGCLISHALDLVGERWAMLVVRELLLGPKRFTGLLNGLPGMSANVLSQRLRELEEAGVVSRRLDPPSSAWVYELTEWGRGLERALFELGKWAADSPQQDRRLPWSADSLLLAIRTLDQCAEDAADDESAQGIVALRVEEDTFTVTLRPDGLKVVRGYPTAPDATVETDLETFHRIIIGDESFAEAEAASRVKAVGASEVIGRMAAAMLLPAG
jgi:DNA-binding HxlR family transcriptional regulator